VPLTRALIATAAAVVLTAAVLSSQTPTTPPASPYRLVADWGALPDGEAWGEVTGVDIDRTNTIVAVRRTSPYIIEMNPAGQVLKRWGEGLVVWPHGFRIDRDGFLWLTDGRGAGGKGQQVFKMTRDGNIVLRLGTAGVGGETQTTFNGPCDVAIAPGGDIFVADGHVNNRIVKFTKDGTFVKAWGRKGTAPGEFSVPHTLAFDSQGRLFVGDRGNRRLQIFDQDGTFLDQWTQFGRPSGMLITADDTLYVADVSEPGGGIAIGSARTGAVREKIVGTLPESIAIDRDGGLYAGETTTGHTIRKFTLPH
jgi:peptidylamidoglycolate lyase